MGDDCYDLSDKCPDYADHFDEDYCNHKKYSLWMSQACKESCLYCKGNPPSDVHDAQRTLKQCYLCASWEDAKVLKSFTKPSLLSVASAAAKA